MIIYNQLLCTNSYSISVWWSITRLRDWCMIKKTEWIVLTKRGHNPMATTNRVGDCSRLKCLLSLKKMQNIQIIQHRWRGLPKNRASDCMKWHYFRLRFWRISMGFPLVKIYTKYRPPHTFWTHEKHAADMARTAQKSCLWLHEITLFSMAILRNFDGISSGQDLHKI